jgi:hypothetical protein
MRRTLFTPALVTGLGITVPSLTTANAEPVDFQLLSHSCTVDEGAGAATFRLIFDRVPDFSATDHHQRQTFQLEIDADATNFDRPIDFSDVDAVIRGGEISRGQGIPVRDREGTPDENSGGWGPVRALIPYTVQAESLTFTVGLSAINDTDGHFRYRVFTTDNGGLTSEAVGAVVPLPLGIWTGLALLGGIGVAGRVRLRFKRQQTGETSS